jgi:hypothetical protein
MNNKRKGFNPFFFRSQAELHPLEKARLSNRLAGALPRKSKPIGVVVE